jgi:hypothetical protein
MITAVVLAEGKRHVTNVWSVSYRYTNAPTIRA